MQVHTIISVLLRVFILIEFQPIDCKFHTKTNLKEIKLVRFSVVLNYNSTEEFNQMYLHSAYYYIRQCTSDVTELAHITHFPNMVLKQTECSEAFL